MPSTALPPATTPEGEAPSAGTGRKTAGVPRLEALVRRAADPVPGRVRGFGLYWAGTFVLMGAWGWTFPLMGVYLYEAGLTLGFIGAAQALTGLLTFLSQAPLGHLSDRVGSRRRFLVTAVAATAPLHAVLPFTRHPALLALLVAAAGVATAAYTTMMFASVSSLARPEGSGRTFSAYRVSGSIGWALTSLSLRWVLGSIGVRGAYLLSAAAHLLTALALWRWLPEPPPPQAVPVGPSPDPDASGARRVVLPGPRAVLRMADVAAFLVAVSLLTFSMLAGAVYFPIFARIELGASDALFGALMAVPAAFEVPFMLWLGRAGDRRGVHGLLVVGALAGALRWALVPLAPGPAHLIPLQVLQSFSFSSMEILGVSFLARRLDAAIRGTAVGLLVSFQALGRIVAPLVAGALGEMWGIEAIFVLASAAAAAGALLLASITWGRLSGRARPA